MTTWSPLSVVGLADDGLKGACVLVFIVCVVTVPWFGRMLPEKTTTALPPLWSWKTLRREGRAGCAEASLVTVEADQARVESRLACGQLDCPECPRALRRWGWARPREVRGIAGGHCQVVCWSGFPGQSWAGWVTVVPWLGGCRGQSSDPVPGGETGCHLVSVGRCGEPVAAGPEVWGYPAEHRQEPLRVPG
jgi:hypothetical protein